MKLARTAVFFATAVFLVGGYAASQLASISGTTAKYTEQMDSPSVKMLSLVLLVAIVGLGFIRSEGEV